MAKSGKNMEKSHPGMHWDAFGAKVFFEENEA